MEQKEKRSKILYTVLAVLLAVGVLPVVLVGWQLVEINRETLRGNEQRFQLASVEDKAKQIKLYVSSYRDQIIAFARSFEIAGGVRVIEQSQLRDVKIGEAVRNDSNLYGLMIRPLLLNGNNNIFAPYAINSEKIEREEMEALVEEALAHLQKKPEIFISSPLLVKSSNESVILLAAPMTNNDQTLEGAVFAVVGLEPVFNMVTQKDGGLQETSKLIRSGSRIIFVVDNNGRVIAHPDRQVVLAGQNLRNLKIVEDWLESGFKLNAAGTFELEDGNNKIAMLGSFTTADIAPGKELGIIAMVNEDAAYASVGQMITKTVFVSVITIVVALLLGTFLAIRITSPIETLALGAQAIAAGDFARRIRVRTRSEIGQLALDFNTMADRIQQYINELRRAAEDNRMLFIGSVRALAEAIDGKDAYTRGHSERVMKYSVLIAQQMGLSEEEIEDIRIAGILHDVGKIGIDDKILKKPAALTDDEYKIMKQHPQIGAKIMSEIPQMKRYVPGMFYHHECLDGHGYPLGLRGDQIPMMARIIAVADVFDAMTTNRPYQRAMETEFALERIKSFVGSRYDGQVVDALIGSYHGGKLEEVLQSYASSQAQVMTS
ncbi:MAG: HD domain-containing phosphohydrolase [Acidobacteriota bacterium]